MTPKIKNLMEVWNARPKIQIIGDTGWDDFFADIDNATWTAKFIMTMADARHDMAKVNDGCITGIMPGNHEEAGANGVRPVCVYLLDGRKIVVGRDSRTSGPAWLDILEQAQITSQGEATPDGGDKIPNNGNQRAQSPAKDNSTRNPNPSQRTGGTVEATDRKAGSASNPSSAAEKLKKARAAKKAKREASSQSSAATEQPVKTELPPAAGQPIDGSATA